MSDQHDTEETKLPPPIKPDNVLDSILSEGGPMPAAKMRLRALAFFLDCVLLTAVAAVVIWKIALPQSHPGAFYELTQWSEQIVDWAGSQSGSAMPAPSDELREALGVANEIQLLIFWLYFSIGEGFFAGSSLGKRICRIRSVSTVTLGAPPILSGIVRGGLKTVSVFLLFPLLFIGTFVALFFNKRRQLGHDICARTAVVDEKYVNLQPEA